jgi:very-short-patch-repair endonuclease
VGPDGLIFSLAERQFGLVGRRQLLGMGVSTKQAQHRVLRDRLVPLSPEVLRVAGSPRTDHQAAMAGVLDAPPGAHLSHRSAAAWWGIPGFRLSNPIEVVIPWQGAEKRTRLARVHYHRDLPADHLLQRGTLPIVSPALTIFLLAGTERPARVERALDNAWARRLITYRQLHQLLARLAKRGRNGIRLMRSLLAARPPDYRPPESGLEARVQKLASDVGVALRRQVDVGDNEWIGRVDFIVACTPDVIEVLSQRYHGSVLDRDADALRFTRLRQSGRRVLAVWDTDVWERPEAVSEAIQTFWRGDMPR